MGKQKRSPGHNVKRPKYVKAEKDGDKNYDDPCYVCGAVPTVHPTRLCGPCCFGDSDTVNGNW